MSMFAFPDLLAPKYIGWLFDGLVVTLLVSLVVSILATLLGVVVAVMRNSRAAPLSALALAYVSVFRNTPLLVQLFFWYFGAPSLLPEETVVWLNTTHHVFLFGTIELPMPTFEYVVGIFGLTLYATAFIAEEIRAGMRGVAATQRQAAEALGMKPHQVLRYVLLPQAARIALLPLLGQYMNIVKSSSLTMAIGVVELSYVSRQVETETFRAFQAFGISTLLYILTIAMIEGVGQVLQRERHHLAVRR
ncbi:MAG TPA: amino acid ABC transporter permease [Rhodocyclaceae bacterium]|nr:amino acid ABC transporter permease [Rhodocyclaceae bacterium]